MPGPRHIAVVDLPSGASRCCGHLHLRLLLAERCRVRLERHTGLTARVASSYDVFGDCCPMKDHHDNRPCPCCGGTA